MSLIKLYLDIGEHLLHDETPSEYLNEISNSPMFQEFPFTLMYKLKRTGQSPKHHPEGSAWNHTMMVIDEAAELKEKSKNQKAFMWAAFMHDIGKPATTKTRKGKITSYGHDKAGAELAGKFLNYFAEDEKFVEQVTALVRWHMQILFVVNDLPFADIQTMKKETDANEIALLGLCDRLGRKGVDKFKEENTIRIFIKKCE